MVKKNPDISIILTKVTWCDHCKDFQEIFNNIESRIKNNNLLKDKKVVLEKYEMTVEEAKFAKKYNEFMDKIDGYPTVLIFVRNSKNKMQGDVIEHTVIEEDSKVDKQELINNATDKFLSRVESKYKSVINDNKDEYVNLEGGCGKCIMEGGAGKSKLEENVSKSNLEGGSDYIHKYKKYKTKYIELLNKYNK
jgi:hypothetical protein